MKQNCQAACRFSLSPMCDDFVPVILGALDRVDTQAVAHRTDKLSTIYEGALDSVEDGVEACFVQAYRPETHMTMEAVFWIEGREGSVSGERPNRLSTEQIHFPAVGKLTIYPLAGEAVEAWAGRVETCARSANVYRESAFDGTILEGDIQDIFTCLHKLGEACLSVSGRWAVALTLSVNSPTED